MLRRLSCRLFYCLIGAFVKLEFKFKAFVMHRAGITNELNALRIRYSITDCLTRYYIKDRETYEEVYPNKPINLLITNLSVKNAKINFDFFEFIQDDILQKKACVDYWNSNNYQVTLEEESVVCYEDESVVCDEEEKSVVCDEEESVECDDNLYQCVSPVC